MNWMHSLGYRYSEQKKNLYVDEHEKEETVRYRIKFVRRYCNAYEPYMMRWVQVPIQTICDLYSHLPFQEKETQPFDDDCNLVDRDSTINSYEDQLLKRGRQYIDNVSGKSMIEFHVDSIGGSRFNELHQFIRAANQKNDGLGANHSYFRKDIARKKLICFGQDEVIFKQFLLSSNAWASDSGRIILVPKDDGAGLMVSAFQSR